MLSGQNIYATQLKLYRDELATYNLGITSGHEHFREAVHTAMLAILSLVEAGDYTFLLHDGLEASPAFGSLKFVNTLTPLIVLHNLRRFHFSTHFPTFFVQKSAFPQLYSENERDAEHALGMTTSPKRARSASIYAMTDVGRRRFKIP